MTRETFSRSAETTSRSVCTVESISLRATAAKPVDAATGDKGASWSSAAAKAADDATSAARAHAALRIVVRNWAGSRDERMGVGAKTAQDAAVAGVSKD